ncbi:MAG TPA: hypothetical protein VMW27_05875 [Thermoanaerobaculia bacterium]|nr:hypothetical protein [Thermoanaerobaculia bacterium]
MEANTGDLPHLEAHRVALKDLQEEISALNGQQSQLQAQKQEVSKQIKERLAEGQRLATFLRAGLKQRYGHQSEKLVEFGLQPLRKRSRGSKVQPEVEAPEGSTPTDSES